MTTESEDDLTLSDLEREEHLFVKVRRSTCVFYQTRRISPAACENSVMMRMRPWPRILQENDYVYADDGDDRSGDSRFEARINAGTSGSESDEEDDDDEPSDDEKVTFFDAGSTGEDDTDEAFEVAMSELPKDKREKMKKMLSRFVV